MGLLGNWLVGGGLVGIVGLLTWITTARGSAVAEWRELTRDLRKDMDEMGERLDAQDARVADLSEENRRFRSVLGDMLRWLGEMAAWEAAGQRPPPPYSHAVLLARLTQLAKGLL